MNSAFTMPIYWVDEKKTKKSTTHLVGMNFYRNCHYHTKNKLKQDLEAHLVASSNGYTLIPGKFTLNCKLYYKNPSCDGSNIIALMEKVFLDFAQNYGIIEQDNVKYHLGTTWSVAGQDKENPRCEIQIIKKESE